MIALETRYGFPFTVRPATHDDEVDAVVLHRVHYGGRWAALLQPRYDLHIGILTLDLLFCLRQYILVC